ncbi:MAG: methyltransferase [Pseudomonadota bacterium]
MQDDEAKLLDVDPSDLDHFTVDAFQRGRFFLVQPKGRGHRAGIDAMLLTALVPPDANGILADFGAGAGAAGMAVAARNPKMAAVLVERSAVMADCARRSVALPQNRGFAGRVSVVETDVTARAADRRSAGLGDAYFDHVIMNPPFNSDADRKTPDRLKASAHSMPVAMYEYWIRAACAVCKASGQLSLIARPELLSQIVEACASRFGGLQVTAIHPHPGADAIRFLLTGIKGSRARLALRDPLFLRDGAGEELALDIDELTNGRLFLSRNGAGSAGHCVYD